MSKNVHPVCQVMRDLRRATGRSLHQIEQTFGVNAIVLGSYERGDRNPPLSRAEEILNVYGYTLKAVPTNAQAVRLPHDVVAELRLIADQIEKKEATSALAAEYAGIDWGISSNQTPSRS